jgi:hypothetical protein
MTGMTFRQTVELAHSLGGKYENGRWYFGTDEALKTYRRRVNGPGWTQEQHANADKALLKLKTALDVDMEPEGQ